MGGREPSVSAPGVGGREPVKSWNGSAPHQSGTLGSERDLTADADRPPTLHTKIDSAEAADRQVARGAGAGRIP
ncbi:hypothetical protein [Streptomyces canus]|uniref:hypothetical protein n=1 Tax=Streptomyces canus TaxID=58343 RepID=UPI0037D9E52A